MRTNGAGGTPGGVGRFFLGLAMMGFGGYLLLSSIRVYEFFSLGHVFYAYGPVRLTGGMMLLPLAIGIGMIFYNAGNLLGWLLSCGSLAAIVVGVIASVRFSLAGMSLLDLLVILVLLIGGLGLFLGALRPSGTRA